VKGRLIDYKSKKLIKVIIVIILQPRGKSDQVKMILQNDIQCYLKTITPMVLSKELREPDLNDFVTRRVYDTVPVSITYELILYSKTLKPVIDSLRNWGCKHRERIVKTRKLEHAQEI